MSMHALNYFDIGGHFCENIINKLDSLIFSLFIFKII